jgi:hypothetical protein
MRNSLDCSYSTLSSADCTAPVTGLVADGAACFNSSECSSASFCLTGTSCPGTCQPRKPLGADAGPNDPACVAPNYVYDGHCRAPAAAGSSCAPVAPSMSKQTCALYSTCDSMNVCVPAFKGLGQACSSGYSYSCDWPAFCISGTCQILLALGAPCQRYAMPCRIDLTCNAQSDSGTCAVRGSAGSACLADLDCAFGLTCSGASGQPDGGLTYGSCFAGLAQGSPCAPNPSVCVAGTFCTGISDAGTCQPQLAAGASCTSSPTGQCATGTYCIAGSDGGICKALGCHDLAP